MQQVLDTQLRQVQGGSDPRLVVQQLVAEQLAEQLAEQVIGLVIGLEPVAR